MRTFIKKNYLHFMKKCIRPPYEKLKSLKSGIIGNSNFENNRDPWGGVQIIKMDIYDGFFHERGGGLEFQIRILKNDF